MELLQKIVFLLAAGTVLLTLNIWFVRLAIDAFSGRRLPDTIAPAIFVGTEDKDTKAGQALAGMILGRLGKIRKEVAAAVDQLRAPLSEVRGIRTQDIHEAALVDLPTGLLDPLNIEMKIGGVEVGGILSWLYRSFALDTSLRLTVENGKSRATVSGLWNEGKDTLWIEITGDTTKPIANERIASAVAYGLAQRQLAGHMGEVGALTVQEFEELLTTLAKVAALNYQVSWGRAGESDFAALFDSIEKLLARTPRWKELVHFSARLADRGGQIDRALILYKEALSLFDNAPVLRREIESRIGALSERLEAIAPLPGTRESASTNISKTLSKWPLSALGLTNLDMPAKVRIGVLGGVPSEGTLSPNRYETVGGGAAKPADNTMAEYVRTVVQAVDLVAPKASFVFARSAAKNGVNSDFGILKELDALAEAKPDILLITFGPLQGPVYQDLFEEMNSAGTLVVLPAGNSPGEPPPFEGTPLAEKILVAASLDRRGKPSVFTQEGKAVLWAPGEKIPLRPVGNKIELRDGTTYSAALAAGIAARILAEHRGIEPQQLVALLRNTAQPVSSGGQRVLNLSSALQSLKGNSHS